jgi:CDP-diacylglycerol--glycerol-3-phosphate 3-phosphatidyltransferase
MPLPGVLIMNALPGKVFSSMPSVYDLKPKFQAFLTPVMTCLHQLGVTPNMITSLALALSALTGILLWLNPSEPLLLLSLPLVLFIRMALNALDGMMARTYTMQSPMGEILNEAGDVLSDLFLYVPFLVVIQEPVSEIGLMTGISFFWLWCLFIILMVLTEFCGVLGKAMVGVRYYQGPMGKSDRAFWIGLFSLLLFSNAFNQLENPFLSANLFAMALVMLSLFTCWNRLDAILKTPEQNP